MKFLSKFGKSLFFRVALLLFLTGAVVAATQTILSLRSTTVITRQGVIDRASQVTGFVAEQAGGALKFGKADQIEALFANAIATSDGTATAGVAVDAEGAPVTTTKGVDPALEALARQAVETGEIAASADGLMAARPVLFGKTSALVGAVALQWTVAPVVEKVHAQQTVTMLAALASLLAASALGMAFLHASVIRPLLGVNQAMGDISAGDHGRDVPGITRSDEIGSIANTLLAFRDSLAEAERATRNAVFQGAGFQSSSAALMLADTNGKIVSVNAAFSALAKSSSRLATALPESLEGTDLDVWGALTPAQRKALDDPAELPVETEAEIGNHTIRVGINSVTDAQGMPVGFVVEWSDITIQRRRTAVLDALDTSLAKAELSADGTLRETNEIFARLAGMSATSLPGQPCADLLFSRRSTAPLAGAIAAGEPLSGSFRLKHAEGQDTMLDGSLTPMHGPGGEIAGHVFIGSDVTQAEAAIAKAEAHREVMEAAQAKVVELLRVNLARLSEGDLTSVIDEAFAEQYESLRADYNTAVSRLHEALATVRENAGAISGESRQISRASEDLSKRTETQAATLEQTVASIGQITESVRKATDGAREANRVVTDARSSAENSGEVVRQAISAMGEIESSSSQISKIISVIDDIAFQTNLLALNAGVEAARAGEAGRGFAVVASEVRALAQRSSEAAHEINALISTSGEHVQRGVSMVGEAGEALTQIVASVSDIADHVARIAGSAEEQSVSLDEINTAMKQLDQVTQHNAAMFEETTAASQTLAREAEALTSTLGHFQVNADAETPLSGHTQAGPGGTATVATPALQLTSQAAPPVPISATTASQGPRTEEQAAVSRLARAGTTALALSPTPAVEDEGWEEF